MPEPQSCGSIVVADPDTASGVRDLGGEKARVHDVVAGDGVTVGPQVPPEALECPVAPHPMIELPGDQIALSRREVAFESRQISVRRNRQCVGQEIDLISHGRSLELVDPLEAVEAIDGLQGTVEEETQAPQVIERDLLVRSLPCDWVRRAPSSRGGNEAPVPPPTATRLEHDQ